MNTTKMGHENSAMSNSTVSLSMPQEPRGSYRGSNEFICKSFFLSFFPFFFFIAHKIHHFHLGQIIWTYRRHHLLCFLFSPKSITRHVIILSVAAGQMWITIFKNISKQKQKCHNIFIIVIHRHPNGFNK